MTDLELPPSPEEISYDDTQWDQYCGTYEDTMILRNHHRYRGDLTPYGKKHGYGALRGITWIFLDQDKGLGFRRYKNLLR